MAKGQIPNYSMDRMKGEDQTPQDLIATRFGEYLTTRNYLFQPHRHSFYHLVYFSKGITQIAYRLNFQDNSYFTRFFKNHTGITPEEFRKKYHIETSHQ